MTTKIKTSLFDSKTTPEKEDVKTKKEITEKQAITLVESFLDNIWGKSGDTKRLSNPEKKEFVLKDGTKKMYWTCMVAKRHTKINEYSPSDMKVGDEEKRRAIVVAPWKVTLSWNREPVDRAVLIR